MPRSPRCYSLDLRPKADAAGEAGTAYRRELQAIDDDCAFLQATKHGRREGEDADLDRVRAIARTRTWRNLQGV